MADVHSRQTRSRNMRSIKSKDTAIELKLRSKLHNAGLRYRVHTKQIPGTPDIYFTRARTAIFVHGCFWHGHDCHLFKIPKTRTSFWIKKIQENQTRDHAVVKKLLCDDVKALLVFECAIKGPARLDLDYIVVLVQRFLSNRNPIGVISSSGMELFGQDEAYQSRLRTMGNIDIS